MKTFFLVSSFGPGRSKNIYTRPPARKVWILLIYKNIHSQAYLHLTSSRPSYIFAFIVFSQALCYKRICGKEFNLQLTTLKNAFTALGYKPKIVKAMSIPREALLKYQTESELDCITVVLTCHPYL